MDSEINGLPPRVDEAKPSLYALVIYLPDPLGAFLDDLRLKMVPGCNPHAHVSVLPPRPLPVEPDAAIAHARDILATFGPFDIELGALERFDATDVVYISVTEGGDQLRQMHDSLNRGSLLFDEPFAYHPHITLAQDVKDRSKVNELFEKATREWRDFPGIRKFRAEDAVFVRNIRGNWWMDLAVGRLGGMPVGPRE